MSEYIVPLASLLSSLAGLSAAIFACWQVYLLREQLVIVRTAYLADHERRKKQSTIEYVNSIRDRYRPVMVKFDRKFGVDHAMNLNEISEDDKNDIRELLSIVEHLAVGVETGVYDIEIVNRMSGSYFLRMRNKLGPYIANAQKNRPKVFCEFDEMCTKIKRLRSPHDNSGAIVHS